MRRTTALAALVCATTVLASVPIRTTIEELAKGADHILIGHVVGVDLIDGKGRQIADENAGTGPGLTNTIRLHIKVDEVLVTNARKKMPTVLKVPLDPFMHYSLGQIRSAHSGRSGKYLILLKGTSFQPVVAGAILRPLDEKGTALRVHAAAHPQKKSTTAH